MAFYTPKVVVAPLLIRLMGPGHRRKWLLYVITGIMMIVDLLFFYLCNVDLWRLYGIQQLKPQLIVGIRMYSLIILTLSEVVSHYFKATCLVLTYTSVFRLL